MVVPSKRTYSRRNMSILPEASPEPQKKKRKGADKMARKAPSSMPGPVRKTKGSALHTIQFSDSESPKPMANQSLLAATARIPSTPEEYISSTAPPPKRNVVGKHIRKDSREAGLWALNQSNSLFLRLPAEIRNMIYKYVLGGNTISIHYETYRAISQEVDGDLFRDRIIPVFKFNSEVLDKSRFIPFMGSAISTSKISNGMTLLNSVCRQLYKETAVLPYKLNTWAFESYSVMVNFIVFREQLNRAQRAAIPEMIIGNQLPSEQVLSYLPGLKKVQLAQKSPAVSGRGIVDGQTPGWYKVVDTTKRRKLVKQ
ncbi:hypothetical protein P154DRAFT_516976 [Amniculicola lignicola CBS 123094]|uniref:DUF7730 domain-containing protein n=1 Tax=Amniculicola lignicola CBS 123094 TaxID=1392246 RepID=A0A6A5X1T3_9PLEO|nr:hypothetical protein P154DRAFT_516976 [Amniculicola lignicola CBS 123094]